jgi:Glycosyl hydrolases family 16
MPADRTPFRIASLAVVTALLATLASVSPPARTPVTTSAVELVADSRPTNAAKVFKWGLSAWEDEFIKPLSKRWRTNHPKLVRNQVGMLTLDSTRRSGTVWATVPGHARRYGRWEARVRSEQNGRGAKAYRVVWELVPAGDYACGSKNLAISAYRFGDRRARTEVRTPSGAKFTAGKRRDLGQNVWHTFAVEVTRTHISWFVDTKVVRTERRDAALTGTKYQMRFRLDAVKGKRMNPARMQMDWVRYYTLERPNAKSIKAPRLERSSFDAGC